MISLPLLLQYTFYIIMYKNRVTLCFTVAGQTWNSFTQHTCTRNLSTCRMFCLCSTKINHTNYHVRRSSWINTRKLVGYMTDRMLTKSFYSCTASILRFVGHTHFTGEFVTSYHIRSVGLSLVTISHSCLTGM